MLSLQWLFQRLSSLLLIITALCLVLMMAHIVSDVVLRSFFNVPIPGTAEITAYYYMIAVVFLPIPLVEMRNTSIQVDLFYNMVSPLGKKIMQTLAYIVQFIFFAIIATQTGSDAIDAFLKGEYVESQIQIIVWPGRFFLPIGFGIAAVITILQLIKLYKDPVHPPSSSSVSSQ